MTKRSLVLLVAFLTLIPTAAFSQVVLTTTLAGANEPGGGDTDGFGTATIAISGTTVTYFFTEGNLATITGAHIHKGLPGVNGNIVIAFSAITSTCGCFNGGVSSGSVTADQTLINDIIANPAGYYVNIHTNEKPGGAIRGQLTGGTGVSSTENPSTCAQTDTALCLDGGRFRLEATWNTPDGQTGAGHGVRLTADSGYFWFFQPTNAEMTVKALNACSFSTSHWVFASGLTNVNVVMKVTDTSTGKVRTYNNPNGTAFSPIQDTSAFACP